MCNRKKVRNHLNLRFTQKEKEDKEHQTLVGTETMIGKDKILDRPRKDTEIVTEELTMDQILIETTVGTDPDKTLEEAMVVTEVDQGKEAPHLEGMVIGDITAQAQVQELVLGLIPELQ